MYTLSSEADQKVRIGWIRPDCRSFTIDRAKLCLGIRQGMWGETPKGRFATKNHGVYSIASSKKVDLLDSWVSQIDCSHGNSQKQYKRQLDVVNDIVRPPTLPQSAHHSRHALWDR